MTARSLAAPLRAGVSLAPLIALLVAQAACGSPSDATTGDGATAATSTESSGATATTSGVTESTSTDAASTATAGSSTAGSSTAGSSTSTTDPTSSGTEDPGTTTGMAGTTQGTAVSTGDDTSGSSSGSTSGSTTGAPLECDDFIGQVTPEQTAISPQGDDEAEQLALEATGEIVAPPAIFARIAADLLEIRGAHPAVAMIEARAAVANDAMTIRFTEAGAAQIEAGTYHAWDCPNALYDVKMISPPKSNFVTLTFDGLYTLPLIYPDYMGLDEVFKIFTVDDLDGDDVCAEVVGDDMLYIFDHGYGDCPEGCTAHDYWGFTVDADHNVTPLGTYSTMDGGKAPDWLMNATECTKWL